MTVPIGGVLSKIRIVSEYRTTTLGEMEEMYMRVVVIILRGDKWLIPYLDLELDKLRLLQTFLIETILY